MLTHLFIYIFTNIIYIIATHIGCHMIVVSFQVKGNIYMDNDCGHIFNVGDLTMFFRDIQITCFHVGGSLLL